jgi:choice-of-anchor B domain-containing protein
MKKLIVVLCACLLVIPAMAQLNLTLLGQLPYDSLHNTGLNDIWGYVDELENEYALVGMDIGGISIVDVTDPANPTEIFRTFGPSSTWRDIKVWNDHAYVTTEAGGGLQIIDLSPLPQSTALFDTTVTLWSNNTAHNIQIDENGFAYVVGSSMGTLIFDLNQDPLLPVQVGSIPFFYVHDAFIRGDTAYLANINNGLFSVWDVADKANPIGLGSAVTPAQFTHNIWVSDDGNYAFTTDEVNGSELAAYDISDLTDIREIDRYQSTTGTLAAPHNTFYKNGFVYTSYYRDGVTVHDVTNPHNIVKVGHYDTSPLADAGFDGCWGVYPYFPSGNLVASDREFGLFVLGDNVPQAARIEGTVTDIVTGAVLDDVNIQILGGTALDQTDFTGFYQTGHHDAGFYDIAFFKSNYEPDTAFSVELIHGVTNLLNWELRETENNTLTGYVMDGPSWTPIPDATVRFTHQDWQYQVQSDANGFYSIPHFYAGTYDETAGKWLHRTYCDDEVVLDSTASPHYIVLHPGIYDDFTFDFGWTTSGTGASNMERRVPELLAFGPTIFSPDGDEDTECDELALITGQLQPDDVQGQARVSSDWWDPTGISDPWINFHYFFYYNNNDTLTRQDRVQFKIADATGSEEIYELLCDQQQLGSGGWAFKSLPMPQSQALVPPYKLVIDVSDFGAPFDNDDDLLNIGIDKFWVSEGPVGTQEVENIRATAEVAPQVWPNPSTDNFNVQLPYSESGSVEIELYDLRGRTVLKETHRTTDGRFTIGSSLENGMYLLRIIEPNRVHPTVRLLKV